MSKYKTCLSYKAINTRSGSQLNESESDLVMLFRQLSSADQVRVRRVIEVLARSASAMIDAAS
ncbi:hypothetical protein KC131_01000 [Pseudomonas sp. JQ170]|uniref:hypothetical protein n=1 Tax=unclassified Pseudomonas TaxID=196821 RepID=UPI00264D425E|nr:MULTISPECIES: hypothetical protein [unclassified Pseudomonas]MDN7139205.1 hypothetical protein [Pseudomonas sp. JQ170]WRO77472.1 hypothetical protein U9R80_07260 [Pseudomonas sp. 170C]